jgi:hypothetical protein
MTTEFAQPYIMPYWERPTIDIARLIVRRYLVAMKPKGENGIEFGYLSWHEDEDRDDCEDADEGIMVTDENGDTYPVNSTSFDYWRLDEVFQHAHYIQKELDITGIRVVSGTGGCGNDDNVYHFYAHQNIAVNVRGHYIMVPKAQAKKVTRNLLRYMKRSE